MKARHRTCRFRNHESMCIKCAEGVVQSPDEEAVLTFTYSRSCLMSNKRASGGFPGGAVVKNPPANAGNTGSSPDPGRSHMPQSN